jgi:hypothetical protein
MPLNATVQRGFTATAGTPVDTADLNAGFLPTVTIEGSVGSSDLGAGSTNSTHIVPGPIAYVATTGSANAYVAAPSPALTALTAGSWLALKANHTNTGAATLNVNGLGAVAIRKQTDVALEAGDLRSGQVFWVTYDGTYWQLTSPGGLPRKAYGELGGSINAYTLTISELANNANSDFTGRVLMVKVGAAITNTGASTLNVNGKGAVAIKAPDAADVAAGALTAGRFVALTFDGTYWQLLNSTSFSLPNVGPGAGAIAYPASITLDAQGRVTAASAGTAPSAIVRAAVIFDSTVGTSTKSVSAADAAADTVTLTGHGWSTGQLIWFDSASLTVGGVTANTPYYVEVVDADTVKLFTEAARTSVVNISSTGAATGDARYWNSSPLTGTPSNVDGVIRNNSAGTFFVDFTTDLSSANYFPQGLAIAPAGGPLYAALPNGTAPAVRGFWIGFSLPGTGYTTSSRNCVTVFL